MQVCVQFPRLICGQFYQCQLRCTSYGNFYLTASRPHIFRPDWRGHLRNISWLIVDIDALWVGRLIVQPLTICVSVLVLNQLRIHRGVLNCYPIRTGDAPNPRQRSIFLLTVLITTKNNWRNKPQKSHSTLRQEHPNHGPDWLSLYWFPVWIAWMV